MQSPRILKFAAVFAVTALLPGCALFNGAPGQQQAAAVLISCDPLQNGGHIPDPPAGRTCEQDAAERYQQYSNDLKDARGR